MLGLATSEWDTVTHCSQWSDIQMYLTPFSAINAELKASKVPLFCVLISEGPIIDSFHA